MSRWLVFLVGLSGFAHATWQFDAVVDVVGGPPRFFHVESAGRKNIAISGDWVAVVYAEDEAGVSRCHLALKKRGDPGFQAPLPLSGDGECAEPTVQALGAGDFLLGWQEADRVWLRQLRGGRLTPAQLLARAAATQVSLGVHAETGAFAAWSEHDGKAWRIRVAALDRHGRLRRSRFVDAVSAADQNYPSLAVLPENRLVVAWEDRRAGHTRLYYAVSRDAGRHFSTALPLNESDWPGQSLGFGRGTGVMRVALSPWAQGVAAVWADKRDFRSGYDVYAAFAPLPALRFGHNEKVQDPFGDNIAQWHPAIATTGDGQVAVVWEDDRDGTPDIWLSWRTPQGWSDDLAVPGASGAGVQSDPSVAFDEAGNLHLVWLAKPDLNAPARLRYVSGRRLR
jgi:hypothetical protein